MARRKKPSSSPGYVPPKLRRETVAKAADNKLQNFINNNKNLKNQSTNKSILSTVSDKPQRFSKDNESRKAFIERNLRADGTPNSAAQAILDFYNDGRNDYSRGLNSLRTSSPAMMDAYARKFPLENFAMQAGPMAFGAMTGIPVAALQAGFDRTKQGAGLGLDALRKGGEFLKKGIDVGASAIDKGMNVADDALYNITDAIEYDTPIGDILSGDLKNKAIDTFKDAIAKREDDNIFSPQNVPGPGGGVDFRDGFDSFRTDVSQQDVEKLDPLANQKLIDPKFYGGRSRTDAMFPRNFTIIEDDPAGLGRQYNQMLKDNQLNFNTQNQIDPNNQFDVAELTQKQIDFMRNPMQSLDFQSRDSLFNKVKQLEDKGFLGFGAQEPTTREEFEQFINSGGIQQAANGGMMEKGIASLNRPEYQRLMGASNFGF